MNRFGLLIVGVALCVVMPAPRFASADPDPKPAPPAMEQAANEFWGRWEGVKPSEAIRRAAITPEDQRAWEDVGRHADDFQVRSGGRCLGHSEIARKSLGENMQYVAYFALYEPMPVRVHLLFYRAKDTWAVIGMKLDAEPYRWLDEAAQSQMPTPPAQQAANP